MRACRRDMGPARGCVHGHARHAETRQRDDPDPGPRIGGRSACTTATKRRRRETTPAAAARAWCSRPSKRLNASFRFVDHCGLPSEAEAASEPRLTARSPEPSASMTQIREWPLSRSGTLRVKAIRFGRRADARRRVSRRSSTSRTAACPTPPPMPQQPRRLAARREDGDPLPAKPRSRSRSARRPGTRPVRRRSPACSV